MKILDITLLSIEEYFTYKSLIPVIELEWWTRSDPIVVEDFVTVISGTSTKHAPITHYCHVRPALIVSETTKNPGEKIRLFGSDWTVLDADFFAEKTITLEGDICSPHTTLLLCDNCIGTYHFNRANNAWRNSDLLKFLYNWIDDQIRETTFVVNITSNAEYVLLSSLAKKYNLANFLDYNFNEAKEDLILDNNIFCLEHTYFGWRLGTIRYFADKKRKIYTFAELCEEFFRKENYL